MMSRGNRKAVVFIDDRDRERFVGIAGESLDRYGVECLALCLMSNHYHMIVMTPRGNLSDAMKRINQVFTQYMNWRHGWTGHVFEGRFTGMLVDGDYYLRNALAYVVMNPVAARLVADPAQWRWSTYSATMGLSPRPDWLSINWIDMLFPAESRAHSRCQFREYLMGPLINDAERPPKGTPAVGPPEFLGAVREHIGATLHRAALPRSYRALHRPSLAELFSGLTDKGQRGRVVQRAHVVHGYRLAEIARFLGLHPNSISRILGDLRRQAVDRLRSGA